MDIENFVQLNECLGVFSPEEIQDIDPEQIQILAQYASQQFKKGDIHAALRLFYLLARVDAWCGAHWLNLGLCYQHFNEHDQALYCFVQASIADLDDPYPPYYATLSLQVRQGEKATSTWCST